MINSGENWINLEPKFRRIQTKFRLNVGEIQMKLRAQIYLTKFRWIQKSNRKKIDVLDLGKFR